MMSTRGKVVGYSSHGTAPKPIVYASAEEEKKKEPQIFRLVFDIHDFADNIPTRQAWTAGAARGELIKKGTIKWVGLNWSLIIIQEGEHVVIGMVCGKSAESNPLQAQFCIRTKTTKKQVREKHCDHVEQHFVISEVFKRLDEIIRDDLDECGTLTIEIEVKIGTEKHKVWYPTLCSAPKDYLTALYYSRYTTSDVTFLVGRSMIEFQAHANILSVSAPGLYELITTTEMSTTTTERKSTHTEIPLPNVDPMAFEKMLEFIYTNRIPELKISNKTNTPADIEGGDGGNEDANMNDDNDHDHDNGNGEYAAAESILIVANRFGCTKLKLYVESYMVDTLLVPSKVARMLLLADANVCALLKEACMNMYVVDSETVQQSVDDWHKLTESRDLLVELLNYATATPANGRKKEYSSVMGNGDGTMVEADRFDVTSLRERLEKYDLDTDGSCEMLLRRWKDHVVGTTTTTSTAGISSAPRQVAA